MQSEYCNSCYVPLEEWEAGFCEGCGIKRLEARQHARNVVWSMLHGRCCPELTDVDDITDDEQEQEMIIAEVQTILDRFGRQLPNTGVIQ